MAWEKRIVTDQNVEFPNRFKIDGVSKTIEPDFGTVVDAGTPINKAYLQPIEDFLEEIDDRQGTHEAKDATTSQKGHVEIATNAEAGAGISTELAVTPAGLMYALELLGLKAAKVSTETNLDNYRNSGTFITPASGVTNLPAGWTQARHVVLVAGSSSYCLQILASSSSRKIAYRVGATLGDWKELLDPSGFTMSGEINMADKLLTRPEIKDYAETVGTIPATTGTVTLDLTTGNVFNLTPTGNCTIAITNPPANGKAGSFTLQIRMGGNSKSNNISLICKMGWG